MDHVNWMPDPVDLGLDPTGFGPVWDESTGDWTDSQEFSEDLIWSEDGFWINPRKTSQEQIDRRNKDRNARYLWRLIEECAQKGICSCNFLPLPRSPRRKCRALDRAIRDYERAHAPYAPFSCQDLKASIKQRKLKLPKKRTRTSLIACLTQADAERHFRFLDLSSEIRMQIYEHALSMDGKKVVDVEILGSPAQPTLLQTCRQIRDEATPIFFRINIFVLSVQPFVNFSRYLPGHPEQEEQIYPRTKAWLKLVGTTGSKDLRRVCFRDGDRNPRYAPDVLIDLSSSVSKTWVVPFVDQPCNERFVCERHVAWSLASWLEYYEVNGGEHRDGEMLECINTANEAMQEFRALCAYGGMLKPTPEGLDNLLKAACRLLDDRRWWSPLRPTA